MPGFTEALRAEVAKIVEMIPNDDLAIQWDLAIENRLVDVAMAEQGADAAKKEAARVCAPAHDVCAWMPKSVHLGHHMCFGTLSGWPSRQPPIACRRGDAVERGGRCVRTQGRVSAHSDAWLAPMMRSSRR